jgi:hypothetical protein
MHSIYPASLAAALYPHQAQSNRDRGANADKILWVSKSLRHLASAMAELGFTVGQETVQNLGVITPHFETDDVPIAPRRRNPC